MASRIGRKRTVTFDGTTYKVRSDKIEIPDLSTMSDTAANLWLLRNTYPRTQIAPAPDWRNDDRLLS